MGVEVVEDALELGRARCEGVLGEKLDEHDRAVSRGFARLIERDKRKLGTPERIVDARMQVIEGVKQGAVHIEEYRVHNPSFRHLADDSTAGPRHIFAHPPCARITLH